MLDLTNHLLHSRNNDSAQKGTSPEGEPGQTTPPAQLGAEEKRLIELEPEIAKNPIQKILTTAKDAITKMKHEPSELNCKALRTAIYKMRGASVQNNARYTDRLSVEIYQIGLQVLAPFVMEKALKDEKYYKDLADEIVPQLPKLKYVNKNAEFQKQVSAYTQREMDGVNNAMSETKVAIDNMKQEPSDNNFKTLWASIHTMSNHVFASINYKNYMPAHNDIYQNGLKVLAPFGMKKALEAQKKKEIGEEELSYRNFAKYLAYDSRVNFGPELTRQIVEYKSAMGNPLGYLGE